MQNYDYIIIGAGVIGLSLAREIRKNEPQATLCIIEKETDVAKHSSGRNSGVLHAGFYYTADSFKAKFTVEGNLAWRTYCEERGIPLNTCGKLVVAKDEYELGQLDELYRRGMANGSNVRMISEEEAKEIEPHVRTFKKALHAFDTTTLDPKEACLALKKDLQEQGIDFALETRHLKKIDALTITTSQETFQATKKLINCAGLYADKIAHDFGFGKKYTMIPFKGLYLKYTKNDTDVRMNLYPVPNLKNPFLGVHFTKTVDNHIKIGPTAIPSFWRENYAGMDNFHIAEMVSVLWHEALLFLTNSFHFRDLAFEEIRKYRKSYFVGLAQQMVPAIDPDGFTEYTQPGIRAQLLDKTTHSLVQDFVIEADDKSVHVLNAVSPAFTCAFPFATYIYKEYLS